MTTYASKVCDYHQKQWTPSFFVLGLHLGTMRFLSHGMVNRHNHALKKPPLCGCSVVGEAHFGLGALFVLYKVSPTKKRCLAVATGVRYVCIEMSATTEPLNRTHHLAQPVRHDEGLRFSGSVGFVDTGHSCEDPQQDLWSQPRFMVTIKPIHIFGYD